MQAWEALDGWGLRETLSWILMFRFLTKILAHGRKRNNQRTSVGRLSCWDNEPSLLQRDIIAVSA